MSINEGCIEMMLNSPITKEQWDILSDIEFEDTTKIWFHTKRGKDVEFAKIVPGHWEMKWNISFHRELPVCSCCGKFVVIRSAYCPNCGAKMAKYVPLLDSQFG